jgi:hypothetical protein
MEEEEKHFFAFVFGHGGEDDNFCLLFRMEGQKM